MPNETKIVQVTSHHGYMVLLKDDGSLWKWVPEEGYLCRFDLDFTEEEEESKQQPIISSDTSNEFNLAA